MIIRTTINDKKVEIGLVPGPIKDNELIRLDVKYVNWEGKENQKVNADKEIENLWDYIDKSIFELPAIKIPIIR